MRSRRRHCLTPGGQCSGCDVEYETCNNEPCEEVILKTDWTNWYRKSETVNGSGLYEERQKFVCRALNMRGPNDVQISTRKEVRFVDIHNKWTECSAKCDGVQFSWSGSDFVKRTCSDGCDQQTSNSNVNPKSKWNSAHNLGHAVNPMNRSDWIDNAINTDELAERVQSAEMVYLVAACLGSWAVGVIVGLALMWLHSRRKDIFPRPNVTRHLRMFSSNNHENTYVTTDDFKMNNFGSVTTNLLASHSATLPRSLPSRRASMNGYASHPKEATIKRTSTIRAKLTADQNF